MNIEKYFQKQIRIALALIIIGVIGLLTFVILLISGNVNGNILGFTGGVAFGFLPMGIGFLISFIRSKRNPDSTKQAIKQMELKNEERNVFLRTKSGNEAFGFSAWLIMGLWILNLWVKMSWSLMFPIILGLMSLSYFILIGVNARKY